MKSPYENVDTVDRFYTHSTIITEQQNVVTGRCGKWPKFGMVFGHNQKYTEWERGKNGKSAVWAL